MENEVGLHHASSDIEAFVHHPIRNEDLSLRREACSPYLHVGSVSAGKVNFRLNVVRHDGDGQ